MPVMVIHVDGSIPVAEDFNGNTRRLNQAIGTGTAITNYAQGDLLYASTTDTLSRRAIGASGEVLTVVGGVPTWSSSGAVSGTWQQRNLVGTLTTGALTVGADSVMLRNSALAVKVHEAVSGITVDPASAGLNGRDQTAAFSAGQDLYAYWISDGTSIRGVWADSAPVTGPDLTTLAAFAGYTYWGLIIPAKWTGASLFIPARLRGSDVWYVAQQPMLVDGRAITETAISMVNAVPAAALSYRLHVRGLNQISSSQNYVLRLVSGTNWDTVGITTVGTGQVTHEQREVPNISQQLFYQYTADPTAGFGLHVDVAGYKVANGGD